MIKPIWAAFGGVALLGAAGGIGVLIAGSGGEEEAVQQVETATPPPASPSGTCIPAGPSGEVRCLTAEQLEAPCPPGPVPCGPPAPTYTCIYTVVGGKAPCLSVDDPRVSDSEKCSPIEYQGRAACLPEGATHGFVINENAPGAVLDGPKSYFDIRRGNSVIKYYTELIEYKLAAEDETNFAALKEVFRPEQPR